MFVVERSAFMTILMRPDEYFNLPDLHRGTIPNLLHSMV